MSDANQVSEVILKLIGIHPLLSRLMAESVETLEGEYGTVEDDESGSICYSHYNLMNDGVLCSLLAKSLSGSSFEFFKKIADDDLDLYVERDNWGSITLSLHLDIPTNPNAKDIEQTFPLDIKITESGGKFLIKGSIEDEESEATNKYFTLYSLIG